MKRAGELSTRFGLHPDTIRDWTDQFEEFFTPGARRGGKVQREYGIEDEVVINTIHELRKLHIDFEEIRARLAAGERINILPALNEPVPPESALAIYEKVTRLQVQLEDAQVEIERLRSENNTEIERLRAEGKEKDERVAALREQVAVLKYQLEQARNDE
jgi:DNA-binding transcriptional MerR regulator